MRKLLAVAAVCALGSVAHAGAVFGSSATSTFSSPITQLGSDSDMDGASDATAPRFRNNTAGTGAVTFTVEWDVTGAENNIHWRLYVLERVQRASVVGVRIEDGSGNFATSTNTFALDPQIGIVGAGVVTPVDLTSYWNRSDYGTVDLGFDFTDVVGLRVTFQLDNPGTTNRATIKIDAIANPEPGTLALFGLGVLGLGGAIARRRRRRR